MTTERKEQLQRVHILTTYTTHDAQVASHTQWWVLCNWPLEALYSQLVQLITCSTCNTQALLVHTACGCVEDLYHTVKLQVCTRLHIEGCSTMSTCC